MTPPGQILSALDVVALRILGEEPVAERGRSLYSSSFGLLERVAFLLPSARQKLQYCLNPLASQGSPKAIPWPQCMQNRTIRLLM